MQSVRHGLVWLLGCLCIPAVATGSDFAGNSSTQVQNSTVYAPPKSNDTCFVKTSGPGLDTFCTYKNEGDLVIPFAVTRKVSVNGVSVETMRNNGLITDATLDMPAWDVDLVADPGLTPERDEVYFNGHLVGELSGSNETWHPNSFPIPIEWVHFPGSGSAQDTVTIKIDRDTDGNWCTAIDWVSLHFNAVRPVVLVPGIFSTASTWDDIWVPRLNAAGIPNIPDVGVFPLLGSIGNFALHVQEGVSAARAAFGVDKVNVVCHSMGGLGARFYAQDHEDIDELIMIATPHNGSKLADFLETQVVETYGRFRSWLVQAVLGPAGYQLRTHDMGVWSTQYGIQNPRVKYTTLAGNFDPGCSDSCSGELMLLLTGKPGDTVVPVSSANGLSYADAREYPSAFPGDEEATHSGLPRSGAVYDLLDDRFKRLPSGRATVNPDSVLLSYATGANGTTAQGQTHTHTIQLDQSAPTFITLIYPSGNLDLSLTSPSGQTIDATTSLSLPGVSRDEGPFGGARIEVYSLAAPTIGSWALTVTAPSVTDSTGVVPYQVNGIIKDPAITLAGDVTALSVPVGQPLRLTAEVRSSTSPVSNAVVVASILLPDTTRATVSLNDSGTYPDATAGDGNYAGELSSAPVAGDYTILFRATRTGVSGQVNFTRETMTRATVTASSSTFGSPISTRGVDTNGNGDFDSLEVTVPLNITTTEHYRVFGRFRDLSGNVHEAATESTLTSGARALVLHLKGAEFYDKHVDGPYTLSDLLLAECHGDSVRPLQYLGNVLQTAAYAFAAFEHGISIQMNGLAFAAGVDVDGFGKFDVLRLSLGLNVDSTAVYRWTGRLFDDAGVEVTKGGGLVAIQAFTSTVQFDFPGEPIGAHAVDGPYHIRDLLITGLGHFLSVKDVLTTDVLHANEFTGWIPPSDRLYVTGTFVYDDSLWGVNQTVPCNLVVAYDTKDRCSGCDSTALDSLAAWHVEGYNGGGRFTIGPILNRDANDDNGPLDIRVRVYYQSNEHCWDYSDSISWFLTMVDSTGARWHYDSALFPNASPANDTLDVGELKPTSYGDRAALHILNTVVEKGWRWAHSNRFTDPGFPPVSVVWSPGYSIDPAHKGTRYDASAAKLYVDGRQSLSTYSPDEWDDPVIVREYGRHVAKTWRALAGSSPSTQVCGTVGSDSTAWNEGWSYWFACFNQDFFGDDYRYRDFGRDPSGATDSLVIDLENGCVFPACAGGCQNSGGSTNPLAVAGTLWDLYDPVDDNPNGDAYADSVSNYDFPIWNSVQKSIQPIRSILGFADSYFRLEAPRDGDFPEHWRVRNVFFEHGIGLPSGVDSATYVPVVLRLYPVRPNPFNPETRVVFDLPGNLPTIVHLRIFDVHGRLIRVLVDGKVTPGRHEILWNGKDGQGARVGSGVYFCLLDTGIEQKRTKMVLAR